MKPEEKAWIDNANYIQLLRKWRFTVTPPGESIFSGESGEYYAKVMAEKRELIGPEGHTEASKKIGWSP